MLQNIIVKFFGEGKKNHGTKKNSGNETNILKFCGIFTLVGVKSCIRIVNKGYALTQLAEIDNIYRKRESFGWLLDVQNLLNSYKIYLISKMIFFICFLEEISLKSIRVYQKGPILENNSG